MKKDIFVVMFGVMISELMIFYGDVFYGLGMHVINLLTIIFLIIFGISDIKVKRVLQSLILLILLRIISLSMPQLFANILLQYSLIYGVMFVPIYFIIKGQNISVEELGINFRKIYIYVPLSVLLGIIAGFVEYNIISPISLIEKVRFSDVVFMSMVMYVFVGTVEEIIFRSILQTRLQKVLGIRYGILASGIMFGTMHTGYGIINEVILTGISGIILGYIFYKSKSAPFVISIHAVADVTLFGILPIYMAGVT